MSRSYQSARFDIAALIERSWGIVQQNVLALVGGAFAILVIESLANVVAAKLRLPAVGHLVLGGPLQLAYFGMALRAARGGTPELAEVFSGFNRFLPAFVANLVMTVAALGILLCIVPGFVALTLLMLTYCYMSDRNADVGQALRSSYETTMASFKSWALLFLVVCLLNLAGSLACGVGVFISMPVTVVMIALAYDQVERGTASPEPEEADAV